MLEKYRPEFTESEWAELRWAYRNLEHPSFAARLSDLLATPFEEAMGLLPKTWKRQVDRTAEASIGRMLSAALKTMGSSETVPASNFTHKVIAVGSGAVGGFFGPLAVLAELPLTTTLMLRSIADIARAEGEDLTEIPSRLACFQVFALGGRTRDDERAEIGYYGMRLSLGLHFDSIVKFSGGAGGVHIPGAIELVRSVAARFGVVISDSVAARMIPVAGALSAAMLNLVFMQHYQDVAKGHFTVRRLERDHGMDVVKAAYLGLEAEEAEADQEFSPVGGF